jgi:hypothetical protein
VAAVAVAGLNKPTAPIRATTIEREAIFLKVERFIL